MLFTKIERICSVVIFLLIPNMVVFGSYATGCSYTATGFGDGSANGTYTDTGQTSFGNPIWTNGTYKIGTACSGHESGDFWVMDTIGLWPVCSGVKYYKVLTPEVLSPSELGTLSYDAGTQPGGSFATSSCNEAEGEGNILGIGATTTPGELQYVNTVLIVIATILGLGLIGKLFMQKKDVS